MESKSPGYHTNAITQIPFMAVDIELLQYSSAKLYPNHEYSFQCG